MPMPTVILFTVTTPYFRFTVTVSSSYIDDIVLLLSVRDIVAF
jgi:hypothetical protein